MELIEKKTLPSAFNSPLCTLKQISSEMSCKPPGEEVAHKTTLAILNKLSSHSWIAKAVLTLAAFALEYAEFWLLPQHLPTELAIIKRVPQLTNPDALIKHHDAILELNNLVKATWQVINFMVEFKKLYLQQHDTKDVPALAPALEQIPVDVYWTIITIASIVTQIDCITSDSEKKQDLYQFNQKINIILNKLRKQMSICKQQIEEAEYYKILKKLFETPTEILEVFKVLIFGKDSPHAPIYDGATKTLVNVEVLKNKNVFLLFSTLDIKEEEISLFIPIYDHITKLGNQYKIVWVPIVEEWNDQLRTKFENLISKMPWYVLHHFAPIKGIKYIKEEWHFKEEPLVVVLNPQGKILHYNAFHMIQIWGLKGFPFTISVEESLSKISIEPVDQVAPVANGIEQNINLTLKEEKNVITYGGKDKEWIQQFTKYANALANDVIIKEANISIELFCLESQEPNIINNFWKGVESLLATKPTKIVSEQLENLLSYKNESGWALLTKGSTVVFVGNGTTILKTVAEFAKWKEEVVKKGFEIAFKEYYEKVSSINANVHLNHGTNSVVAQKIPQTVIECPQCHRTMEVLISYQFSNNVIKTNVEL
ncbi:hypothetical protein EYC94_25760 [Enterobacter hormaechei]|nr:hypothetical protein EYC94_25760 [Enterobacter hormaechei]